MTTDNLRVHAVVQEYQPLIAAIDARRRALRLSMLDVDRIAGLADGYTAHMMAWQTSSRGRIIGPVTMPLLLQSLGIALAVVNCGPCPYPFTYQDPRQLRLPLEGGDIRRASELDIPRASRKSVRKAA